MQIEYGIYVPSDAEAMAKLLGDVFSRHDPPAVAVGGIDAAHEGTHVSDISDPRYANSATTLSDFSLEYRGYQTSAWAAQALGVSPLAYDGGANVTWNSGWEAADRQTLMDKGITQHVTSIPGHPETTPHNPWPN